MKNPKGVLTGFAATLWMFMGTDVMGQGSLTPPGAPGGTMHTLGEIYERTDPRTPISSLPYTINRPGSYYVTGNLSSREDGIIIQSSGVAVDLMGFSLTGDGEAGDYGIHVDGSQDAVIENLAIKGGRISGFYRGLYCEYMNNSRINELVVSGNSSLGVYLYGYGNSGQCNGNTIADCTISGNGYGVSLYGNQGQCNGNTLTDCTISGNEDDAIALSGYQGQCNGNTIRGNMISRNAGNKGIYLSYADGNRIEGNNVWGTTGTGPGGTYGIRTSGSENNLILKNSCVGNGTNYSLDSDNTFGPIVDVAGELGTADGASHPWANFSR